MAETRQNKAPAAKFKTTGNILACGLQIQVIPRKQTSAMQMHHKTHMDLGYTAMGLHKTMKHQNNSKIPVQSPALNSQCTAVCLQS
jgi:hypothetical protein